MFGIIVAVVAIITFLIAGVLLNYRMRRDWSWAFRDVFTSWVFRGWVVMIVFIWIIYQVNQ